MVDFPWFSIVMLVYQRVRTLKMLPTWEVLVVSPRHLMKLYRDCRLQDLRLEWKTWGMLGCNWGYKWIPPGKLTKNYGKSQLLMGKSTINGPFSIAMFVYQRVFRFSTFQFFVEPRWNPMATFGRQRSEAFPKTRPVTWLLAALKSSIFGGKSFRYICIIFLLGPCSIAILKNTF